MKIPGKACIIHILLYFFKVSLILSFILFGFFKNNVKFIFTPFAGSNYDWAVSAYELNLSTIRMTLLTWKKPWKMVKMGFIQNRST